MPHEPQPCPYDPQVPWRLCCECILCRFVTGDWAVAERRATAVPVAEGDDEDDDVYGDFEDIEAGLGQTGGSRKA